MVIRGHKTFYSLQCGGIRFLLSLSTSCVAFVATDGYKSSGQAGMWECDSDGGELPDRRQVAATQGPSAAVTRREPPLLHPPSSGPRLRPLARLPAAGDRVTGTSGCPEGGERNTTQQNTRQRTRCRVAVSSSAFDCVWLRRL